MALLPGVTKAVLLLSGYRCRYCGEDAATADHIIPQRDNGPDAAWNLVAACRPCNSSKGGARLPREVERELLIEAWITAPDVERMAAAFRVAQHAAARRPPLALTRDPQDMWRIKLP